MIVAQGSNQSHKCKGNILLWNTIPQSSDFMCVDDPFGGIALMDVWWDQLVVDSLTRQIDFQCHHHFMIQSQPTIHPVIQVIEVAI